MASRPSVPGRRRFSYEDLTIVFRGDRVSVPGTPPQPFGVPPELDRWGGGWSGADRSRTVFSREEAAPATPPTPHELGDALAAALFTGGVRDRFQRALGALDADPDRGLRLRLVASPSDAVALRAVSLPWELIAGTGRGHLALDPRFAWVRDVGEEPPRGLPPFAPPLRILAFGACPAACRRLALEDERESLRDAWRGRGIELHVAHGTPLALREALRDHEPHVLHFMGHGELEPAAGRGSLVFETGTGERQDLSDRAVAQLLAGCPVRLVVLNACDGGRVAPVADGPAGGVAAALLGAGVPAVLAMGDAIGDAAAIRFAGAFYRAMAAGDPVEAALAEGRQALFHHEQPDLSWTLPLLFARTTGEVIERWWLPEPIRRAIRDSSSLIEERTEKFVGREFVFAEVDRFLTGHDRGFFHLVGEPGIGKTAIAGRLVTRRGWLHHFCHHGKGTRPSSFLTNLSAQLIERHRLPFEELPATVASDAEHLEQLLRMAADRQAAGERTVVVVDGLDEAEMDGLPRGSNPLKLPHSLPRGVYFVLASRPWSEIDPPLLFAPPYEPWPIDPRCAENERDVYRYLEPWRHEPGIRRHRERHGQSVAELEREIWERSEGNFMYLRHVLPELAEGTFGEGQLPQGLVGYYEGHWRRMKRHSGDQWQEHKLPVLAALTVTPEPAPIELLARYSGLRRARIQGVVDEWRPFLERVPGETTPCYQLYHRSFFDFLHEKDQVKAERLDLEGARRRITECLLEHHLRRRD